MNFLGIPVDFSEKSVGFMGLFLGVPYRAPPLKGATGPWLASFGWPAVIWRPHSVGPRSGLAWLAQLGWLGLGLASFS